MTRSEVAAALGVSEKTVTRHIAAGRLPARYVKGKTGQQLEIAPTEVRRLQAELQGPPAVSAAPTPPESEFKAPETSEAAQVPATALARPDEALSPELAPALTLSALARIVRAVMDEEGEPGQPGQAGTSGDKPRVPVESKLLLSLDEAVALSGVPRAHLDAARREGKLRARRVGRGFKIRRAELETFVASLWD